MTPGALHITAGFRRMFLAARIRSNTFTVGHGAQQMVRPLVLQDRLIANLMCGHCLPTITIDSLGDKCEGSAGLDHLAMRRDTIEHEPGGSVVGSTGVEARR